MDGAWYAAGARSGRIRFAQSAGENARWTAPGWCRGLFDRLEDGVVLRFVGSSATQL